MVVSVRVRFDATQGDDGRCPCGRSDLSLTAVGEEFDAGDEARLVGSE
jgi:hypothetical protein